MEQLKISKFSIKYNKSIVNNNTALIVFVKPNRKKKKKHIPWTNNQY